MMRPSVAVIFVALALLVPTASRASEAQPFVDKILKAKNGAAAHAAALELAKKVNIDVQAAQAQLTRARQSKDAERRGVLRSIGASVPNAKGRFSIPRQRKSASKKQAEDDRDWLAELAKAKDSPAYRDVITDLALMRALAATKNTKAADHILALGFSPDGSAYRDECGRRLRAMAPYSLPALIRASQQRGKASLSLRKYAIYQQERMDRRSPFKAVGDAPSDSLKAEIMATFAQSRHRTGVYAVMRYLDAGSPNLRAAARKSWMVYANATPIKPPERRLSEPGGKLSDQKQPLWLDHQQLMHEGLRKTLERETGALPAEEDTVLAMTERLFKIFDDRRSKVLGDQFENALKQAKSGDPVSATDVFDDILAQDPQFARRDEMAEAYLGLGDKLSEEKKWRDASSAYGKAHSVAPSGESAKAALSKHHFARGKEVEKTGGDASAEFSKAREVGPEQSRRGAPAQWMLWLGVLGALLGVGLLLVGFRRRA